MKLKIHKVHQIKRSNVNPSLFFLEGGGYFCLGTRQSKIFFELMENLAENFVTICHVFYLILADINVFRQIDILFLQYIDLTTNDQLLPLFQDCRDHQRIFRQYHEIYFYRVTLILAIYDSCEATLYFTMSVHPTVRPSASP